MGSKNNDLGRAYEYACLCGLVEEVSKRRPVNLIKNDNYFVAERSWNSLTDPERLTYSASSHAAIMEILELEPRIAEDSDDELQMMLQPDAKGAEGDVRDVIIVRRSIQWEIGLSLKHNNIAVKHSRLGYKLDFGKSWYGIPCSDEYWAEVKPIFDYLAEEKSKGTVFKDLPDKGEDVYRPLVTAFIHEVNRQYAQHKEIPARLVEYLLGRYDFYKVASMDRDRRCIIQPYNIHGTLNKSGKTKEASIKPQVASLPERIINLDFAPFSNSTAELCMDKGWQFTFRIHNASEHVEPSLKFDIQIVGVPITIVTITCNWSEG